VKAPIIRHGNWEDNYDDPAHPIPSLTALDIQGIRKSGGSDMIIVVASPLQADERSQHRLLSKIELYLGHIRTEAYRSECGEPTPENTSIVVRIHPQSAAPIFDLLERCKPWVAENHATLRIESLETIQ